MSAADGKPPEGGTHGFLRGVVGVGAATALSRLLGFLRDAGVAALLGTGPMGAAFALAMLLPTVLRRLLADGAVTMALAPRLALLDGPAAERLLGRWLAASLALGALVALSGPVWAPDLLALVAAGEGDRLLAGTGTRLLLLALPYVLTAAPAAVLIAAAQARGQARAAAFAPVVLNCGLIAGVASAYAFSALPAADWLALSLPIGGLLQFGFAIAIARRAGFAFRLRVPRQHTASSCAAGSGWRLVAASTLAHALPLLAVGAVMVAAAGMGTDGSGVAALHFAERLLSLPVGIVGAAIGGLLAVATAGAGVAGSVDDREERRVAVQLAQALRLALALALPAAIGLAVLAPQIVGVLLQRGAFDAVASAQTAAVLAGAAPSALGFVLARVLVAAVLGNGRAAAAAISALAVLPAGFAAPGLADRFGPMGLGLALSMASLIGLGLLLPPLRDLPGLRAALRRLLPDALRIASAAAAMAAALLALAPALTAIGHTAALAASLALGLSTYGAILALLRFPFAASLGRGRGKGAPGA